MRSDTELLDWVECNLLHRPREARQQRPELSLGRDVDANYYCSVFVPGAVPDSPEWSRNLDRIVRRASLRECLNAAIDRYGESIEVPR